LGRYERAASEYSKALELKLDPEQLNARFDHADAHAALGKHKAARDGYTAVMKSDPNGELGRQAKEALATLKN